MARIKRLSGKRSISGRVLHKESGTGLADLVVDLLSNGASDLEGALANATRLSSSVTDANGAFSVELDASARGLWLVVLAPEEPGLSLDRRVLYGSRDLRNRESFLVRLPTELLVSRELAIPGAARASSSTRSKVDAYVAMSRDERDFNLGVVEYQRNLATEDAAQQKTFREAFVKRLRTDFSAVPLRGALAKPGDDIGRLNHQLADAGLTRASRALEAAPGKGVPVTVFLSAEDRARLAARFGAATDGFVEVSEAELSNALFASSNTDNPGTLLVRRSPISTRCGGAPSSNEHCASEHLGLTSPPAAPPPASPPSAGPVLSNETLPQYLQKFVEGMPRPDAVLAPGGVTRRPDQSALSDSVDAFALRRGPAEVPAFYDFHSLQIAFDHVWQQLIDERIPQLAYAADALGKTRLGLSSVISDLIASGRGLTGVTQQLAPVEVPPAVARFFDVTREEFNEMSFAHRDQLVALARTLSQRSARTVQELRSNQSLIEQGERLIDAVRHDDFHTLHRTLRELHARLSGQYEFTVFAADKDRHSVNFGLLNTYRQQWTPVTYQAGKLVKTIPLSPKEERKYSVRVSRSEKRSTRESRKNNSSITDERSSTSRVEAEIIARAQSKTNFGLTAEGDFDIGIAEGKSTTTFGVEALSESAQTRRDFREAVARAVQDYKAETSTEVVSEVDDTSEVTESGTLVNPNDELSVTYLFYELQRRYRISEALHRVRPVVLVAQPVPSPEQITPAWVLSHDWILNRVLLDDSFRPTLRYLANNSVGDDFSLRELRKNLRQQRNLVETLRIEFSAASAEADNRYKALEGEITNRIDEEHAERTDGLGHDIWDFFGGGGQDPEAAKARELAAKDAHQYALEKAQKAAAALREEVNTLHALTADYNKTLRTRLDEETKVQRLLVHLRNNIFHYLQAIWSLEPPDQRFLRLHKVRVPVLELKSRSYRLEVTPQEDLFATFRAPGTSKHRAFFHGVLEHQPAGGFPTRSLAEVADLDTLLGFKGNYLVFPLKEHNALTQLMAAPYVDTAFGAMDPDELSQVSLEEYGEFICCLQQKLPPAEFAAMKPQLKAWFEKLMAAPLRNGDEVVIPTGSLFIENLVGHSAILEDYKLRHRELDVFKADQEVRKAALENLRRAARLLNAEWEDPDVEKKVLVQGSGLTSFEVGEG